MLISITRALTLQLSHRLDGVHWYQVQPEDRDFGPGDHLSGELFEEDGETSCFLFEGGRAVTTIPNDAWRPVTPEEHLEATLERLRRSVTGSASRGRRCGRT
jgi:hypothetical protein